MPLITKVPLLPFIAIYNSMYNFTKFHAFEYIGL